MALTGALVDGMFIAVGSIFGLLLKDIPERFKETVTHCIALMILLIGLQMALETESLIMVLTSLIIGGIMGELLRLEELINRAGEAFMKRIFKHGSKGFSPVEGFITTTLIFCVGAMAIIGALNSGLQGNHEVLITKGVLDGFMALVFTTTMGYGVIFSVFSVIIYEGSISLLATQIVHIVSGEDLDQLVQLITGVGGLIIVAIGLNLLKLVHIRIGNLLPSLAIVVVLFYCFN
ncbi:MAG TPA: DUF554 domain-containing protein [Candidatus Avamphibacillus intestinigallinarum]|nr:DUF554 domain-containing protein [Candidatus Avamphibacillus intestinigallinarum]